MLSSFGKGLIIGFSIAAPVGPIGLLCIRRSIAQGRLVGFVSGLGAATADAAYGALAATGLTALTHALVQERNWLQFGGGLFLVYLGLGAIRRRTSTAASPATTTGTLGGAYASILALTLTNPMTVLSFVGIFAGFGMAAAPTGLSAGLMVTGVFCGSAFWWLLLSTAAGWLGGHLQGTSLRLVNFVAGATIVGFGLWQLLATVRSLR